MQQEPLTDLRTRLDTAFAHHSAGDLAGAAQIYKDILQASPRQPDALHMLGVIAKQVGNNALALNLIEAALSQRPDMALGWHNRALLLRIADRKEEALVSARQAVAIEPALAEAWNLLGYLYRDKKDLAAALAAQERAVALRPDDISFLGNQAVLLLALGRVIEAYALMKKIEKRDPAFMPHTMGNILKAAGYPDQALPYYRKACEQAPDNDEMRTTAAMAHLLTGDYDEGWRLWETRPSLDPRFKDIPFWNGQKIDHLLLHEDQGIGDALQCARFIPQLKNFAEKLTLQLTRTLAPVFRASFPDIPVLTLDDPVPPADARIRLLSLPAIFKIDSGSIPFSGPYLRSSDEGRQTWKERFVDFSKPRIGLVWGGNPDHLNDAQRSLPFAEFAPLLRLEGAHFVSLQKGPQKSQANLAASGLFDADPFLNDFADTSDLLAELDLLISVDTSVVHLAGALGCPVWLLLPFDPDWRWLLGREDSPWYPHLRLFRQAQPHDWRNVIGHVAIDLQRFLKNDATVLLPTPRHGPCLRRNPSALALPD